MTNFTRGPKDPERLANIVRLKGEGMSATEIARELGLTRNAVIGALHRHAPKFTTPRFIYRAQRAAETRRVARGAGLRPAGADVPARAPEPPEPYPFTEWVPSPDVGEPSAQELEPLVLMPAGTTALPPGHLLRVRPGQCRWPTGGDEGPETIRFLCKRAALAPRPYCDEHCAAARAPRAGRAGESFVPTPWSDRDRKRRAERRGRR